MKLKISLKSDGKGLPGRKRYDNEVNADNYKEISLVLLDLDNSGLPIKKAIKEFKKGYSDWDIALGI